jgi:hypothetical protein
MVLVALLRLFDAANAMMIQWWCFGFVFCVDITPHSLIVTR